MGIFDKVKNLAGQHGDKVDEGLTKAGEMAKEKTGGKYDEQIDTAVDKARDFTGQDQPGEPPR